MAKKIKIDKKKLKQPDEFISMSSRIVEYLTGNWKKTVLIMVVIFGALGINATVRYYKNYTTIRAQEEITQAVESFKAGKGVEALSLLQKAAKRGGEKAAGMIPLLYLGNHFFKVANYERALEYYEKIISQNGDKSDPLVRELALFGAGYSLEQMGNCAEAKVRFQQVADDPSSFFGDSALFSAARCLEHQGELRSAAELYKRIEAEHPNSLLLADARARLKAIEAPKPDKN
jgi:tetratricopeptide (TPR) repeat protein